MLKNPKGKKELIDASLSSEEQERQRVFDQMPKELQRVALRIRDWRNKVDVAVAIGSHKAGLYIRDAVDDARYGDRAIDQLAAYLGWKKSYLYGLRLFAVQFGAEEVAQLVEAAQAKGRSLSVKHFISVSGLTSSAARGKWLRRAISSGWTAAEMFTEMRDKGELSSNVVDTRGGRPPARFVSIAAGVHDLRAKTYAFQERLPLWQSSVLTHLAEHGGPDEFTETIQGELLIAEDQLKTIRELIDEMLDKTSEAIARGKAVATGGQKSLPSPPRKKVKANSRRKK